MNRCVFSKDRRYRYSLVHSWDSLFPPKLAAVIALNPSTADENDLDPTLRRIRGFCMALGYTGFCMLNAFAFRATDPKMMKAQKDPIGPKNDQHLVEWARSADTVIVAWGTHGSYLERDSEVYSLLRREGVTLHCWGVNSDGSPKHPLYLPRTAPLVKYVRTVYKNACAEPIET